MQITETNLETKLCKVALREILDTYMSMDQVPCLLDEKFIQWRMAQYLSFSIKASMQGSRSGTITFLSGGEPQMITWSIENNILSL